MARAKGLRIRDAADYVNYAYNRPDEDDIKESISLKGVQAYLLKNDTLVIPGTNEFSDWYRFNFDVYDLFGGQSEGFEIAQGDSGARWHAGFLEHAMTVYAFAKPLKPKFIVGHSLGAASAQIVGSSLRVPTIAFASPKTNRGDQILRGEEYVVNFCRTDDTVCHVPPGFLGFRHVGKTVWLNPKGINFGEDHRIDQYIALMGEDHIKEFLPITWPEEIRDEVAEKLTD